MGQEQPIAPATMTPMVQDLGVVSGDDLSSQGKDGGNAKSREVRLPFPCKVYEMLEDAEEKGFADVVSWSKEGDGFAVHNKERFTKEIIPRYYNQTRYKSFQRQLSLYGFERATAGSNKGLRYHEKLRRGCKHLCREMKPVGYKPRGQEHREKLREKAQEAAKVINDTKESVTPATSQGPSSSTQGIPAVVSSNSIYKENPQVPPLLTDVVGFSVPAGGMTCSQSITERLVTTDDIAVFEGMPFYLMTTMPPDAQRTSQPLAPVPSTDGMDGSLKKAWEIGFAVAMTMNPATPMVSSPGVVSIDTNVNDVQLL